MLILTRKEGEGVKIGDNIYVKVIETSNGTIKLGFDAPADMMILRDELESAVKEENLKANSDLSMDLLLDIKKKMSK